MMKEFKKNEEREERISDEIVVDAYGEEERAGGWYCYLEDKITFPFKAEIVKESGISPLKKGEGVVVSGMADESECDGNMFVQIKWNGRTFGIPLEQVYPVNIKNVFDEDTREAIEDWHYWVNMGYCF